jgi:hypothetical protein
MDRRAPASPRHAVRIALSLARVVAREIGGALAARVMPVWIALLFGIVEFWDLIPWTGIRIALAAAPPWVSAAVGVGGLAAWTASWGGTLRALLVDRPALRPWWRSGLGAAARAGAVAPIVLVLAAPMLIASGFWPAPLATLAWRTGVALALGSLAWGPARARWLALPAATALLGGVEAGARAVGLVGALPILALALAASIGPLHAGWTVGRPAQRRPVVRLGIPHVAEACVVWRPRSPLGALVWRDLACLARTAPDVLGGAWLPALPLATLLWGLRVHGGLGGEALGMFMATAACACAPLGATALGRLRTALGASFHVRRWPVPTATRVLALVLVAAATFLPTGVALAATTPQAGVAGVSGMGLAALACASGAALLAVWRPHRPLNLGWHLGWALAILLLGLWGTPLARAAQLLGGAGAFGLTTWRLRR